MKHSLADTDTNAKPDLLVLSCEHGGNEVPTEYEIYFRNAGQALNSHRGYDIGALGVAMRVADQLAAPLFFSTTTRLLIDLNRSLDSATLFSEFVSGLNEDERGTVIDRFYKPYRQHVTSSIASAIQSGHRVIHVGIHSFTDVLDGRERAFDLALLFDEARPDESSFCNRWQQAMVPKSDEFRHRFNEPYHGSDDGLTTALRHTFESEHYLGLEVEIRQGLLSSTQAQHMMGDLLAAGLRQLFTA